MREKKIKGGKIRRKKEEIGGKSPQKKALKHSKAALGRERIVTQTSGVRLRKAGRFSYGESPRTPPLEGTSLHR